MKKQKNLSPFILFLTVLIFMYSPIDPWFIAECMQRSNETNSFATALNNMSFAGENFGPEFQEHLEAHSRTPASELYRDIINSDEAAQLANESFQIQQFNSSPLTQQISNNIDRSSIQSLNTEEAINNSAINIQIGIIDGLERGGANSLDNTLVSRDGVFFSNLTR